MSDLVKALRHCNDKETTCVGCPLHKHVHKNNESWCPVNELAADEIERLENELAKYKDAEAQGQLIMLPVKEHSQIFRIVNKPFSKNRITAKQGVSAHKQVYLGVFHIEDAPEFGKTVFLTREAAEATLEVQA